MPSGSDYRNFNAALRDNCRGCGRRKNLNLEDRLCISCGSMPSDPDQLNPMIQAFCLGQLQGAISP